MRAVDTSVLVRLLVRDDADQVEMAEAFVASGAWISHLVLAETVRVRYITSLPPHLVSGAGRGTRDSA